MTIMDVDLPGQLRDQEATGLAGLTPAELAEDGEAARLALALARVDDADRTPVRVSAFNSFIG